MTITLHTLPKRPGRSARRVGRGHGSGRGTYAGRGIKGQRARTGGRTGNIRRALTATMSKLPKRRGFHSRILRYRDVPIAFLEKTFSAGDSVTPRTLADLGFRLTNRRGYKILGNGTLTKVLTVHAHAFSGAAARAIIKAGGKTVYVKQA